MTGLRDTPVVYNIAPGNSFADALAKGILDRAGDPLALADYTILLPSRRACRTVREAFLRLSRGSALLLPHLRPIGDADADEIALLSGAALDVPPAVTKAERQILLARAVVAGGLAPTFEQAQGVALALGHFLDETQTEGLSFDGLENIVPDNFEMHWQKTLSFLKVLTARWPDILNGRGVIDIAARRNLLLRAQAKAWEKNPPVTPVIAAGSTGTVPAAADLLALVARLPRGALVLPGLDTHLDEAGWEAIGADHPQYNLKKLLQRVGLGRDQVRPWTDTPLTPRARLLSEGLRPAETTERWRRLSAADLPGQALDGFSRIDCDTAQEEADVIALLMRETLETPEKTCALITPDRRLARRVQLALTRYGLDVDDSGGQPITELPLGLWLMLTAEAAAERLSPVPLLALLKHPFLSPDFSGAAVRFLDARILRGPRPAPGLAGLRAAVSACDDARGRDALFHLLDGLEQAAGEFFTTMAAGGEVSFATLLEQHIAAAERLASGTDAPGAARLWRGAAGEGAAELLRDLLRLAPDMPPLAPDSYVLLLRGFLKGITVRARYGTHPRLLIMGTIEARMACADRIILSGLNEGSWPDGTAHDPWMSRPMRAAFGLPPLEKSISLSAHDFVQAASAGAEVFMTRARKVDGAPANPSRWLLRLETLLSALGLSFPPAPALAYRQWLRDRDTPAAVTPARRPAPRPPVAARPRKLSVTKVETWMRDPYQIYARYILGLSALDPLDADAGGAERGTFVHVALDRFIRAYPDTLPPDAGARLLAIGRSCLAEMRIAPETEAFWWPRFENIAQGFLAHERRWRDGGAQPLATERAARWTFDAPAGAFTLTAKADRIDRLKDGTAAIIDYKSGFVPSLSQIESGFCPQLPLEAAMLAEGAFEDVPPLTVAVLAYWRMTGKGLHPFEEEKRATTTEGATALMQEAAVHLKSLIACFDDPATPYLSRPSAARAPRFSDYEHLARVREWGAGADDEEAA